jgi:hypothetical protein
MGCFGEGKWVGFFEEERTGPPWNATGTRANQEGGVKPPLQRREYPKRAGRAPPLQRREKRKKGDPSFVRADTEGRGYARLEDWAGFGYVGVEFVDYVGVLLFDYAAF